MGIFIPVEDGVQLFVEDINPTGKKTIMFLHGWPLNHHQFEYQYNMLPAMGYRCIGVDWRGFGHSDKPYHGYTFDRLADDIRVVIETLQLSNITLLGHSTGGGIAIRYMARYQGHGVSKLVLAAAAAPYSFPKEAANTFIADTYKDRPKMLQDMTGQFFFRYISGPMADWFMQMGLEAGSWSTAHIMTMLSSENVYPDLGQIRVPTLIIHGIHDQVVPFMNGQETQKLIPHAVLVPFHYSGHASFIDERDAFTETLMSFIG